MPSRTSGAKEDLLYRLCPSCGERLDPGEICDCRKNPPPGEQDRKAEKVIDITDILTRHRMDVKEERYGN